MIYLSGILIVLGAFLTLFFGWRVLREIYSRLENLETCKGRARPERYDPDIYNEDNLKHCPFCGYIDTVFFEDIYDEETGEIVENAYTVGCAECQITFSCGDSTKEDIARLWNRRDEK